MTAQDFDLREFSNADLKNLRDKIDSFETRQAPAKVREKKIFCNENST